MKATAMGLGTVWLGGTFTAKSFAAAAKCFPGETVRIVSPVGHIAKSRSIVDSLIRSSASSANRKTLQKIAFRARPDGSFEPISHDNARQWIDALECVRWAPSACNSQPWCIVQYSEYPSVFSIFSVPVTYGGTKCPCTILISGYSHHFRKGISQRTISELPCCISTMLLPKWGYVGAGAWTSRVMGDPPLRAPCSRGHGYRLPARAFHVTI